MNNHLIYVSYSPEDERWKVRLEKQLGVLETQGTYAVWDKSKTKTGDDWLKEIITNLRKATVVVILVSENSLSPDYILNAEIKQLLEHRFNEGLKIFPVIISDCAWRHVKWLARMNPRPTEGALDQKKKSQVSTELMNLVVEIIGLVSPEENPQAQGGPPPERARVESPETSVAIEPAKTADPFSALEEEAASNPELRRRLYDIASRLKSRAHPASGEAVTFYPDDSITQSSSPVSGGGFGTPAEGEGNGN